MSQSMLIHELSNGRNGADEARSILHDLEAVTTQRPFSDQLLAFAGDFARRLRRASRGIPELTALAHWMRKAELVRLRGEFASLGSAHQILVPRGVVFHVPPTAVDTIFVYSWLLSAMVGNKNVIRLSSRSATSVELILTVFAETLAQPEHFGMRGNTVFVRYGHDRSVTDVLSAGCDVRVIWGGDRTVDAIRRSSLSPAAVELTFPDRRSISVIDLDKYRAASEEVRDALAERFYNDSFWFDQMGCSSPREIYWLGARDLEEALGTGFFGRLRATVRGKGYLPDAGVSIRKKTFNYRAVLDHPVSKVTTYGNEVSVLTLTSSTGAVEEFAGAGTFFNMSLDTLLALRGHVGRKHQTMTYFGLDEEQLGELVRALNGQGIDRIVPIGEALTFSRYWDGFDLLQAFSRRVTLQLMSEATG
jgi:Acyl-CoA reductase (LuxC)